MKRILIFILLCSSLFFCTKDKGTNSKATSAADLLVKDNAISGWTKSGRHWTTNSAVELRNEINGGSVIYTSRGFVEAAMQTYEGTILNYTETVELYIYDQGNEANAKSVYDEVVRGLSTSIDWMDGAGTEAKIEFGGMLQRIIFYHSKYFVSLTISSDTEEALDVLKIFATSVDSNI
jgi:hypothetical protein